MGWSLPLIAKPSIVSTCLPWTLDNLTEQAFLALPSTRTVQAPQLFESQPFLVPVRSAVPRRNERRVSLLVGEAVAGLPFSLKRMHSANWPSNQRPLTRTIVSCRFTAC